MRSYRLKDVKLKIAEARLAYALAHVDHGGQVQSSVQCFSAMVGFSKSSLASNFLLIADEIQRSICFVDDPRLNNLLLLHLLQLQLLRILQTSQITEINSNLSSSDKTTAGHGKSKA